MFQNMLVREITKHLQQTTKNLEGGFEKATRNWKHENWTGGGRDRGGGGRGWRELVTRLLVIGQSNHGLLVGYQLDDNGKC